MALRILAILLLALPWAVGCEEEDVDADDGLLSDEGFPEQVRGDIEPVGGFYRGEAIEFYDLGAVEPLRNSEDNFAGVRVNPMYVFVRGGAAVSGQLPIVDAIPASASTSPFFQLVEVEAGDGYEANEIKSRATLLRRELPLTFTEKVVHCPLIAQGARPVMGPSTGDVQMPVLELWYRRQRTRCFVLEGGEALVQGGRPALLADRVVVGDRTTFTIGAQDIFLPEVRIFDEEIEVPGNIITDRIPGDPGYSPVCLISEIKVKATYEIGGYDALADVDPTIIELRTPEAYRDISAVGVLP